MSEPIPGGGSVEAGTWVPEDVVPPIAPVGYLADDIDPLTGELRSIAKGIHPIDAEVVFLLRSALGSGPALGTNGLDVARVRKLGDGAPRAIQDEITFCLRLVVQRGDIRIDKILVGTGKASVGADDMAAALVVYTNLLTQRQESATVRR